jgi:hypothetical protein
MLQLSISRFMMESSLSVNYSAVNEIETEATNYRIHRAFLVSVPLLILQIVISLKTAVVGWLSLLIYEVEETLFSTAHLVPAAKMYQV